MSSLVFLASRGVGYLAAGLIFFAACLTVVDVFMRSVLNIPIYGTNDMILLAMTVGVCACFPIATISRRHMVVDVLGRALGRRWFWLLEAISSVPTILVLGAFSVMFAKRAMRLADMNEGTQLLVIPLAPFWWVAAAAFALSALAAFQVFCVNVSMARAQADIPDGWEEG